MALVWASLGLAAVLATIGAVVVLRSALDLWRAFKRSMGELADSLDLLSDRIEGLSARADRVGDAPTKLEPSLERLRTSMASLSVLRAAIQDVQHAAGRVTAVYPRK
jgi:hypothetical protein